MKTVLVVAAHADDEALGCGGTIARHVAEGDDVYAIFVADGVTSRIHAEQSDLAVRHAAAERAKEILGIRESFYLGLPDNCLDSIPLIDVVRKIEPYVSSIQPNTIYTHHHGDLNVDHRITHQAVMTACRPCPGSSVREIFTFEVVSSTEWASRGKMPFVPNMFVDVADYLSTKIQALVAYEAEMRSPPHSRCLENIENLARHRGYAVGVWAAEGFEVVRMLK